MSDHHLAKLTAFEKQALNWHLENVERLMHDAVEQGGYEGHYTILVAEVNQAIFENLIHRLRERKYSLIPLNDGYKIRFTIRLSP